MELWAHQGVAFAPFIEGDTVMTASVLISILVTFLVIILVLYLINMLPIDGRAKQIVRIIVIVIGVLSLLKYIAVF
jgi:predicted metal-dependent hydrolase